MSRAKIRQELKKKLKDTLKAPRTGKIFNDTLYKLDSIYGDMDEGYAKKYLKELIINYYHKYANRHKKRDPVNINMLKGGCMSCYTDFMKKEGGSLLSDLGDRAPDYIWMIGKYLSQRALGTIGNYALQEAIKWAIDYSKDKSQIREKRKAEFSFDKDMPVVEPEKEPEPEPEPEKEIQKTNNTISKLTKNDISKLDDDTLMKVLNHLIRNYQNSGYKGRPKLNVKDKTF